MNKVLIVIVSGITFIIGLWISSQAVTSGPGGQAKLSLGDFKYEIIINDIDISEFLQENSNDETIKEKAKEIFKLYEIDTPLITAIRELNYDNTFSKDLRNLRDTFVGPFHAPDIKVEVKFSNDLDSFKAKVCPQGPFYRQRVNIALADFSNMYPIDDAGIAIVHGCPTPESNPKPIVISYEMGKKLFDMDDLPDSISAVARVLPNYVIIQ